MSERKVLNKYYPPDFDPSNIPRLRLAKTRQYTVRIMTPCNMKCNTCGDYIAKAKKFNARKETVDGDTYLGLKIFRFYFKCPTCMAEITFKTDPKNCDYELEHGATRNFQALRMAEIQAEKEKEDKEEEERLNPMKMLENRTKSSRREMEELEALEELKEKSQVQVTLDTEEFLGREKVRKQKLAEMIKKQEEEEDENELKNLLKKQNEDLSGDGKPSGSKLWLKVEGSSEQLEIEIDEPLEPEEGDEVEEIDEVAVIPKLPEKPKYFGNTKSEANETLAGTSSKPEVQSHKRKLAALIKVVPKAAKIEAPKAEPKKPAALSLLSNYSDSESSSD